MDETAAKKENKGIKRMSLEEIQADYPNQKIVAGSLCWLEAEEKQAVTIECSTEGCKATRTVRTSDLHQVTRCEACTRKAHREKARSRRQARKAAAKAS